MKRVVTTLAMSLLLLSALAAPAFAARGGTPGSPIHADAIYADGELFGVIALSALPYNGNDHSFDEIYVIDGQPNVAEAAPGPDYNGGRWLPVPVTWNVTPYLLTSSDDVHAAEDAGDITLGAPAYDGTFLCPLIP